MPSTSFTDGVTLTAASWFNDINDGVYKGVGTTGVSTVSSATTPDIFATTINGRISYTGTTTCTGFVAAPSAGATRILNCTGAAVFTAGANLLIDGVSSGNNLICAANDILLVIALTTTQFRLVRWPYAGASSSGALSPPQGRITLTTAVPVTTSDVTGATTVYYTPFCGNQVPIYNGASFTMTTFAELSQATTDNTKSPAAVAASKVYDLFVWSDSGTIRCTRGPAWTNDTTPGTGAGTSELQMINGIMTNKVAITNGPGANLGTYVGTIRSDGSSQINDSFALRYVANAYNQVERGMSVVDTTDSWTYTSTTWRQARATAANQLAYVSPQLPFVNLAEAFVQVITKSSTTNDYSGVGVGVDSTSVNSAQTFGGGRPTAVGSLATAKYCGYPGIGAHTLVWLEACEASVTTTWYGDNGVTYVQAGITGRVKG